MSVTNCRSCNEPISFIQTVNGRWRPVEVVFEELVAEGAEILVVQQAGSWSELSSQTVRIYKAHACPENPAWNRGRPRMRVGNEATGELLEDEDASSDPLPSPPDDGLTWQERHALERRNRWLAQYPIHVKYPCRECGVEAGEPCTNAYGAHPSKPHRPRHIATFFDEDDPTQQWPPRHNGRGRQIMSGWLAHNADIFAIPEEQQ